MAYTLLVGMSLRFQQWPKTEHGRLLCRPENPMPIGDHEAYRYRWEHTNTEEVGDQENGYPGGDIVKIRCKDCGLTWKEELPQ